jgi:hypothetical protein
MKRGESGVIKRDEDVIDRGMPVGIVIRDGEGGVVKPSISAFIWGGKVRPVPTLPFGRWKQTAA